MAGRGYLGKISAVVTANTSDFERKLQAGAKVADQFGRSMAGVLSSASAKASRSLGEIFTPLQKVQRAMAAATNQTLDIKTSRSVGQISQLVDVTEQLLNPLAKTAKGVAALSLELQGRLDPSLRSAQSAVLELTDALAGKQDISSGAFARAAEQVNAAERALASATAGQEAYRRGIAATASAYDAAITKERELLALRQKQQQASANSRRDSLSGAAGALTGKIPLAQAPIADVTSGLAARAKEARAAVAAALQTPAAGDLQQRLRSVKAELENIASEEQRLRSIDPLGERVAQWAALDDRIRAVDFRLGAVSKMARDAGASVAAIPEVTIDVDVSQLENSGRRIRESLVDRLIEVDTAWDMAVRGLTGNISDIDNRFRALTTTISGMGLEDRVSMDSAIAEFRNAVAAGEGYARQLELIGNLERMVGVVESRPPAPPLESQGPPLPPGYNQPSTDIGRSVDSPIRQIETLRGAIVSAKGQLDSLPLSVKSQFIPAIVAAEAEFLRLKDLPNATAEQIENAANEVKRFSGELTRAQSIQQKFSKTSFQIFDDANISRSVGQLEGIRQVMLQVGATAGGELGQAYDRLSQRMRQAANDGTLGSQRVQREIEDEIALVARLAAETGRTSAGAAASTINRAGDVGRAGVDKFSLGLNQAAFAVDDFLSSTGGLEFKLRAISNNITQLGFVVGGTTGLFVGLGAVIAGQAAVGLVKWINGGRTAEDSTKALNDALARQKSLVEELAQAFKSLNDSIARTSLSQNAQGERAARSELEDISSKRKQLRESRVSDLDPAVQRERAEQSRITRELEASTDGGQRVALLRLREESQKREREAAAAAASRPVATAEQVRAGVEDSIRSTEFLEGGRLTGRSERLARERRARAEQELQAAGGNRAEQARIVEQRIAERQQTASRSIGVGDFLSGEATEIYRAREDVVTLTTLLESIKNGADAVADSLALDALQGAQRAAASLEKQQQLVADAVGAGILPAIATQVALDALGKQLEDANEAAAKATTEADAQAAKESVGKIQQEISARQREVDSINATRAALDKLATALDTARQEANANLQSAQSQSDSARRADLGRSTDRTRQDRQLADSLVGQQQAANAEVDRQIALARDRDRTGMGGQTAVSMARIAEIDAQLNTAGVLANGIRERLVEERARLQSQVIDLDPEVKAARDESTRIAAQAEAAQRGRELSMTPAQRVAADISADLDAIRQFYGALAEATTGLVDFKAQQAAIKRTVEDRAAQVAPLLAGFREERLNASLQGPSRAALNASDIKTTEGNNELNRLLRGDDPSKDVNLVELQKQSDLLQKLLEAAEKAADGQVVEIAG